MPKFYVYERVPHYIEYRKIIEAENLEAALKAAESYAEIDADEQALEPEDVIETLPIMHDAEPVEAWAERQINMGKEG